MQPWVHIRVSQMCQKFKIPISHIIFPLLTSSPLYNDQNFVNIRVLKVGPSEFCVLGYRSTIKPEIVYKICLNPLSRAPIFTLCLITPPHLGVYMVYECPYTVKLSCFLAHLLFIDLQTSSHSNHVGCYGTSEVGGKHKPCRLLWDKGDYNIKCPKKLSMQFVHAAYNVCSVSIIATIWFQ